MERHAQTIKIPLNPPFDCLRQEKDYKGGSISPPFAKACLPVGRGGWEGFKEVIFLQFY